MGKSQRTKGAVGEREVCDLLTTKLGLTEKITRNIGQARDGGNDIDVGCIAIEVKRRKTLGTVYGWLRQAITAVTGRFWADFGSAEDGDRLLPISQPVMPVVIARQDGGEWIVITRLDDFITLAGDKIRASL